MRTDKALTLAGYTRKQAKSLIREGRVSIGGMIATDPAARAEAGDILIDGSPIDMRADLYLMINKPPGVVTATQDARFKTVMDLLPEELRRRGVGPVGRLDKDVTGLVILTTDGQLAHRLISPKWAVEKVYRVTTDGPLDEAHVARMARGVALSDFAARPARLTILSTGEASLCELAVTEGKYHQVKRMFGALERPVLSLNRRSIAGVELDGALAPGEYRHLSGAEIQKLYDAVRLFREKE